MNSSVFSRHARAMSVAAAAALGAAAGAAAQGVSAAPSDCAGAVPAQRPHPRPLPHAGEGVDAMCGGDAAGAIQRLADEAARTASAAMPGARVEVRIGRLDPRLKLAPCATVTPYLPPNTRLWGRARIGLRCDSGPVRWNVWLPVTVSVHAPALVAARALPAGTVLAAGDLRAAEVDLADGPGTAVADAGLALGRPLARALPADAPLRSTDLKPRLWFAAGDSVRVVAVGAGYAVTGDGQALGAGHDGQPVRVRTGTGRIVTGVATGARRVEVAL